MTDFGTSSTVFRRQNPARRENPAGPDRNGLNLTGGIFSNIAMYVDYIRRATKARAAYRPSKARGTKKRETVL
jgi:hypothetical protein